MIKKIKDTFKKAGSNDDIQSTLLCAAIVAGFCASVLTIGGVLHCSSTQEVSAKSAVSQAGNGSAPAPLR